MKILKYLIKPVKIIMFLCVITALVYFRSIIFHDNVNQYIDLADSYIEQKLNIDLPAHKAMAIEVIVKKDEMIVTTADINEAMPSGIIESPDVVIANEIIADAKDNEEKESKILLAEDTLQQEIISEISNKPDESMNLIKQLSETVESLGKKIDLLFDKNYANPAALEPVKEKEVMALKPAEPKPQSKDAYSANRNEDNTTNTSNDPVTVSSDVTSSDTRKILLKARQTFWNGNSRDSEKLYLELVDLEDNDPDAYGELGNVYYAQGKWEQAGKAYYEAAIRLLDLKRNDQVSYLLMVIQGLDMESAEKLRNKIMLGKT